MKRKPCGHCNGTGVVPLNFHLEVVLKGLRGVTSRDTTALASRLQVRPTAMINRLRELERLELVECLGRDGRALRWRLVRHNL